MFPWLNLILMIYVAVINVNGKPTASLKKDDPFSCGDSPSISRYIGYNNIVVHNNNNNQMLKIIHGHDSTENDWPWMVTLNNGDSYGCTGSIISSNYVLTAHHCFASDTVGYGSIHKKLQKHVKVIEWHFINNTDFGLLKVEKPFIFDGKTVAPICLSSKFDADPNEILVAAGFGLVFIKTVITDKKELFPVYNGTEILQETIVEHRADSWCVDPEKKFHPETMICVGGVAGGVAHGDSGSPIMAIRNNKWYALGALYAGFLESIPSDDLAQITHAWYTKVKLYCNWLSEVSHGEVICEN